MLCTQTLGNDDKECHLQSFSGHHRTARSLKYKLYIFFLPNHVIPCDSMCGHFHKVKGKPLAKGTLVQSNFTSPTLHTSVARDGCVTSEGEGLPVGGDW